MEKSQQSKCINSEFSEALKDKDAFIDEVKKDITVIWCDTGYNTNETYKHAEEIIKKFNQKC